MSEPELLEFSPEVVPSAEALGSAPGPTIIMGADGSPVLVRLRGQSLAGQPGQAITRQFDGLVANVPVNPLEVVTVGLVRRYDNPDRTLADVEEIASAAGWDLTVTVGSDWLGRTRDFLRARSGPWRHRDVLMVRMSDYYSGLNMWPSVTTLTDRTGSTTAEIRLVWQRDIVDHLFHDS